MNKLSCNVTKDLLPVYLDDICSEETKALVEDHLGECAQCKQFLEELNAKENTYNKTEETYLFFQKAKKYLNGRNNIIFCISLLFAALITIYSEISYHHTPDVIVYVSLPILMGTFFLTEPMQHTVPKKRRKLCISPFFSTILAILLVSFHFFFVDQLTILFSSANTDHVWGIFRTEPPKLGPFVEKIYLICIFIEIILLINYYLFGERNRNSSILGQNASWFGMGLGIMYRQTLFRMDTLEGFKQLSMRITGILVIEFIIVYVLNILYAKTKKSRW